MANKAKELLKQGKAALGGWECMISTAAAETMARAGFDWVAADIEHAGHSVQDFIFFAQAVKSRGSVPLARVFDKSVVSIRRILDAGAQGIIVPMIRTADDAREVVAAAKYPPLGIRGVGAGAFSCYGIDLVGDMSVVNDDILVIVMVETKDAVDNIDEIMSIDGVDGMFLGPMDLSYSYGYRGQTTHPVIFEAMEKARTACMKHGKAAGMHLGTDKTSIKSAFDRGFTFVALSTDAAYIYSGSRDAIKNAKEVIQGEA
jgi:2-dehydro-3-deoxy-L-rhamnonate aldolase